MENKRLKVGLFIDTFFPTIDGVIMVVDNYARRLQKYCDVVVFAPQERKAFDDSILPYKVVRCKKKFPAPFLDYDAYLPNIDKNFQTELENEKLDLVHIHDPFSLCAGGLKYARKHNIPCIATMHSQYKQDFVKILKVKPLIAFMLKNIMSVYNKCDECWTMNPACVDLLRSYGYKGKTSLISNATDNIMNDNIIKKGQEIREKYVKNNEKLFISVGRIVKLKNLVITINSMKELKNKGFPFHLFIIGKGNDLEYFQKMSQDLDLTENITFLGQLTNLEEKGAYYLASDLHIFPSFYDTDGIVKIEAACYSTPTLFAKNSIASSSITENANGYIAEATPEDFANKIIEIFNDPKQYKVVCENANKDLYIHWDDTVKKVYENYVDIIKNYSPNKKQKVQKTIKCKPINNSTKR